jgi:hypothetical protein
MTIKNTGKWMLGMLAVAVLAVPGLVAAQEARVTAVAPAISLPANASRATDRVPTVEELLAAPAPRGCARNLCRRDVDCDNICPGLPAFCDTSIHFCVLL